jgi:putative ABC transport system permease protein
MAERFEMVRRDLRFVLRGLRRSPLFALTVIATLALGIGANSAIFSFVNGLLLRPLPYRDDSRLVTLWTVLPQFGRETASLPDFKDWKAQGQTFVSMAAAANGRANLSANGQDPERIRTANVTANFFTTLGVRTVLGRDLADADERVGSEHVVLLSERLWRRRFHGDPSLIGRTILMSGVPFQVIGVVPAAADLPAGAEAWSPLVFPPGREMPRRGDFLHVYGRLREGTKPAQARAEMAIVAGRLGQSYPATNRGIGIDVEPLRTTIVGDVAPALLLLSIAVGFVLLIACANIANLLLARATSRQREVAVRVALGASRGQIAYQVMLESVVLSVFGGIAGIAVAWGGVQLLKANAPASMPLLEGVRIDSGVLLFTLALTVCTGLGFGLAPAIRASRLSLRTGANDGAGTRSDRVRRTLVAVQVALALTLLSGAGLFLQSLIRLQHVDLGFDERNVLTAQIPLSRVKYPARAQSVAFFDDLQRRVSALPGVMSAGYATDIPLGPGYNYQTFDRIGHAAPGPNDKTPDAVPSVADSQYFAAMGMTLTQGRWYGAHDDGAAPRVALVNEDFARRYYNGASPVGERISFDGPDQAVTIVGVVKTTRLEAVGRDAYPQVFTPLAQGSESSLYLVVRTHANPLAATSAVRSVVTGMDAEQPIADVHTMAERVEASIGQSRLNSTLLTGLSALALLIAALGIYGVVAYGVARRTREIGVRQALGATGAQVIGLIARQGVTPVLLGVGVGLVGSVALGMLSRKLLFATAAIDPVAFAGATALLMAIAGCACVVPAMRAANVSPSVALRTE